MYILYEVSTIQKKTPRNYREKARKEYLKVAQKKAKTRKDIRNALKQQLGYLGRNIRSIDKILDTLTGIPLKKNQCKYLLVIQHLYQQQKKV